MYLNVKKLGEVNMFHISFRRHRTIFLVSTMIVVFSIVFGLLFHVSAQSKTKVTVQRTLEMSLPKKVTADQRKVISIYKKDGWTWNTSKGKLQKKVAQPNSKVLAGKKIYITNSKGIVYILIKKKTILSDKDVKDNQKTNRTVTVNKGQKTAVIRNTINLDKQLDGMGDNEKSSVMQKRSRISTSYKKGATVTCNRFNGPKGNYKYYNKFHNPVRAGINFYRSDCYYALAYHYPYCLRDYGSYKKRYCAPTPKYKRGRCSKEIHHSTKFHKHH